ncbi:unnamed protein product [Gongylonema pulchrum]|uniref:Uncharacterized protein n=1 Tax=Gongylonema pulchrum TaxID=637853 RepID=A0A183DUR5_9BILA|nr:unnamed protein product [Gongylonema pulchrum]
MATETNSQKEQIASPDDGEISARKANGQLICEKVYRNSGNTLCATSAPLPEQAHYRGVLP